jgi:hypothetical protein
LARLAVETKFVKLTATILEIYPALPSPITVEVNCEAKYVVDTKLARLAVETKLTRLAVEIWDAKFAVETREARLAVETKLARLAVDTKFAKLTGTILEM